jgi:hypothetical protein
MENLEVELSLIPAPSEPPEFQVRSNDELLRFQQSLRSQGVKIYLELECREGVSHPQAGTHDVVRFTGEFLIRLAAGAGPIVGTVIGAWLHAKYGRKARLKIGDIEAEAQTEQEVKDLLRHAEEFQLRNQPKKIHEP